MKIAFSFPLLTALALPSLGWSQAATPAAPATAAASQDPNRVVATIDGQKLTAKQVNDMLKPFAPEQRKQIDADLPKAVEQIYMQQRFAEAAEKLNLQQQSPYKDQIDLARRGVLARAYVAHLTDEAAPTDPQQYYDSHKAEFETVKLSGIFVGFNAPGTPATNAGPASRTEDAARAKAADLEKKLVAGADFAGLARTDSEHQTASKGGDLGEVPINNPQVQVPADVKNAVAKLQPGQVSEPIKIQSSFLIVKLDARETTPFDKARPGIEDKLKKDRANEIVKKETDKYAIHVDDPAFFQTAGGGAKIPSLQRSAPPAGPATPRP